MNTGRRYREYEEREYGRSHPFPGDPRELDEPERHGRYGGEGTSIERRDDFVYRRRRSGDVREGYEPRRFDESDAGEYRGGWEDPARRDVGPGSREEYSRWSSAPRRGQQYEYPTERHEPSHRHTRYSGGISEPFGYVGMSGGFGGQYGEQGQHGEPNIGRDSFGSGYGAHPAGQYSGYAATMEEQRRRGLHSGRGPKNYRRSDERIREDVSDRLQEDDQVDASEMEVHVKDGIVTLTGTVNSRTEKRLAEDCCERIAGVKDVLNQLRVTPQTNEADRYHSGGLAGSK
jgi:osmotically-inducible protein OsmY